ncbi:MAG TPA: hypothetical protein VMG82_09955 [Candidatus Sulfotelmatobacter sp.]|nr:hypothetical protein [Candidatus Sulfotelmatobacter sp.]
MEHFLLGAYWQNRTYTARQFIEAVYAFLSELRKVSPLFSNLCVTSESGPLPIPDDLPSFVQTMMTTLEDPESSYTNPDPSNHSFGEESTLAEGFVASLSGCDINATDETAISILISAGAHGHANATGSSVVKLPPTASALVSDSVRLFALLTPAIHAWSPEFATITSRELLKAMDPRRRYRRPFGSIMYYSNPGGQRLITEIPNAKIVHQKEGNGTVVSFDVSLPWKESSDILKPAFNKLSETGLLLLTNR